MNLNSAIILCLLGAANGWSVCSPKRVIQRTFKKGILVGAAATGGAAVVAVGAAVAYNQINKAEVYEPTPGSLNNQVVVVTGGTTGMGLETAKRLAAAGATIVLTSRTEAKGNTAVEAVTDYLIGKGMGDSNVYNLLLDLDDLTNVKQFAASYNALQLGDISVLVNNAGVMAIPSRELTVDGYERTFQSNHLGHFVLTAELFPYFSREGTKVINVSSSASNMAAPGLDMDNLNGEKSYGAWSSYGISKLANILFTNELQRKADAAGQDWLTTVALHPGVVNTDLWKYIVGEEKLKELKAKDAFSIGSLALSATSLFTKTPEEGASTQIFLAAEDNLVKGAFYEDMKEKTNVPSFAKDEEKAKALWDVSEEFGDVRFDMTELVESEVVEVTPEESMVEEKPDTTGPVAESSDEEILGDDE
eukprot:CAMPEP_0202011934 /NCGR_PEP_ID=MMETSP0905-20130828/21730_1 /ASSEMBLY_ACC=CAM_ASM_000554 /TAXON_ID=420261 /ORGANISM="Thalassiosira antarctica, Strain CCMP982" /LENGTH=418 /DNA_ID=CAMNT_0048570991 /DNA_START=9 /DNA_END=1262 /DNA_ORIENTATION=+